jgi:hypothetical protein
MDTGLKRKGMMEYRASEERHGLLKTGVLRWDA